MYPLSQVAVFTEGNGLVAAGTGTTNGNVVDMSGYDAVTHVVQVGTVVGGAVLTLNAQGSANANGSSPATEGTTGALTPVANGLIVIDVIRPANRYQLPQVVIATQNVQILSILTIRYRARTLAVVADSTAQTTLVVVA